MELKNRHPLNAINGYENLSMLESLIPFIEYPFKLPLALFIKFSEIRLIINAFRSIDSLTKLGLHSASGDPLDMICALTGISPELLKMMFSMMGNNDQNPASDLLRNLSVFTGNDTCGATTSDTGCHNTKGFDTGNSGIDFSNLTGLFQTMQTESGNNTSRETSDAFDHNIQHILAEYDLQQAEEYHSHTTNLTE